METATADPELTMMLSDRQVVEELFELWFQHTAILYSSNLGPESREVGETVRVSFPHQRWQASRGTSQQCYHSIMSMNPMRYTDYW